MAVNATVRSRFFIYASKDSDVNREANAGRAMLAKTPVSSYIV
jgi:hypothetical protein